MTSKASRSKGDKVALMACWKSGIIRICVETVNDEIDPIWQAISECKICAVVMPTNEGY